MKEQLHNKSVQQENSSIYHYVVVFRHINAELEPAAVPITLVRCYIQPETM